MAEMLHVQPCWLLEPFRLEVLHACCLLFSDRAQACFMAHEPFAPHVTEV